MGKFWDRRFEEEGKIWGDQPSPSAEAAARLFQVWEVEKVLVPGCAYGRHCLYFSAQGFEVIGLDSSRPALDLAEKAASERNAKVDFIKADVSAIPLSPGDVDAIYDRALLHLLLAEERRKAVAEYHRVLRKDGILFLTCFSTEDAEFGEGPEIEPNTFDAKGGRPAHFFSEAELKAGFPGFHISVLRRTVEYEEHGDEEGHYHHFWQMIAEKE